MLLYYLLIFLLPFPEYDRFAGFAGGLTLVKVVGIATVVYTVFRQLRGGMLPFWPEGRTKYYFILFFVALFLVHFSEKVLSDWSVHVALFFIIMRLVESVEVIVKSFWITIAALVINCIQSIKGIYIYHWYYRAAGSFGDPNYFALALIIGIAMGCCLYHVRPGYRLVLVLILSFLLMTLMLTASRGGILGLGVMSLLFIYHSERRLKYLTLLFLVAVPLALYLAPGTITRLKNGDLSTRESTQNRLNLLKAGINMIKAKPFTGVGYANFKPSERIYYPDMDNSQDFIAHNSYLSVAAELGLPILALFMMLLYMSYVDIRRIVNNTFDNDAINSVAMTLKIAFIGYCCSIAFLTAEREKYLWLLVLWIMALSKISSAAKCSEEAELLPVAN